MGKRQKDQSDSARRRPERPAKDTGQWRRKEEKPDRIEGNRITKVDGERDTERPATRGEAYRKKHGGRPDTRKRGDNTARDRCEPGRPIRQSSRKKKMAEKKEGKAWEGPKGAPEHKKPPKGAIEKGKRGGEKRTGPNARGSEPEPKKEEEAVKNRNRGKNIQDSRK